MDTHYRQNHYGKPHEYLVNSVDPRSLHTPAEKNHAAWLWLYICIAAGLIVFALIVLGMWLDCRRKRAYEQQARANLPDPILTQEKESQLYPNADTEAVKLYPNPEIEEKCSLCDGSMTTTTTEIQPKATQMSYEKIDEMSRKSSGFGSVNIHQPQNHATHYHGNTNTQETYPPSSSSTTNNSSISLAGNSKRMSKMESFPYEEYGIPQNERQSIKTRVQDLKTYDTFLHLTPIDSDLMRGDSIQEDDQNGSDEDRDRSGIRNVGKFESQATLPRTSIDKTLSNHGS